MKASTLWCHDQTLGLTRAMFGRAQVVCLTVVVFPDVSRRGLLSMETTVSRERGSLMRAMTERARVLVLVLIMTIALLLTTGITIWILYRTAFDEARGRLVETVGSQARLIESVARYNEYYEQRAGEESNEAELQELMDEHLRREGFGDTGEFTLARREGDSIVFLLESRRFERERPVSVPFSGSELAEPMRRALQGQSGTVVGLDYRGVMVLAAYEPIEMLGLGIVAKMDVAEVRGPFLRAGLLAIGISLLVLVGGGFLLVRVSNPLITDLRNRSRELEDSVAALSESEERFRTTFELAGVGIAQVSLDGRFTDVNQQFCSMTGYSAEEIKKLSFRDISHPEDQARDLEYGRQLLAGEIDRYSMDKRSIRKDSSEIWVNRTSSLVRDKANQPRHFIAVVEDISARKAAELAIKRSLEEKEVLLKEIHHRVKNNMQVISSLLSLQASNIDDVRLRKLFQESQSRVRAMALIHEILYDSSDLSSIDLRQYVSSLVASLTRMYGADTGRVHVTVESDDITLGIDAMVPCGLAINELISNSLKYAFPDERAGEIIVRLTLTPEGMVKLVVRDDGVGLPADLDIRTTKTMGMGLVVSLVEKQLRGLLDLDRSQGTCFTIVIPSTAASA
jgi:PAS domain S-box-containing protein